MRWPKPKKISKYVPELMSTLVPRAIEEEYSNRVFDKIPEKCSRCGNTSFKRHDTRKKIFCNLIYPYGYKTVYVNVKRYKCEKCGFPMLSEGAFYPKCRYGKPIVDICLFLSAKNPFDRVESILMAYGIQVDGDTVNNYAKRFKDVAESISGLKMCGENIGINMVKILFNVKNVKELKDKYGIKKAESVSDETYPAKKGAKKKLREENMILKQNGERPKTHPEGFTIAVGYLPSLKSYASLVTANGEFNYAEARALSEPLDGSNYNLTDGHRAYSCFKNREWCIVHKTRNMRKKDPKFRELKKKGSIDEIYEYAHKEYLMMKSSSEEQLSKKHPQFVENGKFGGALTTNAIEGGNWRIKYELRTPYQNKGSILSRTIQILIHDSLRTFSCGQPIESFGSLHSEFVYGDIMSIDLRNDMLIERYHYDIERNESYLSLERKF